MAEAFGVAGSAVGVISLGIQTCQGIIRYYGSWKDGRENVEIMCHSVESLGNTLDLLLDTLQAGALGRNRANVEASIAACTSSVENLKRKLTKIEAVQGSDLRSRIHEQGRRLMYPFRESTLARLKEIVSDIRANLELALDTLHLQVPPFSLIFCVAGR